MRDRLAIAATIFALTLLSFFQFPGHTYLGSDTEIYVPMLEHIWDSSSLAKDFVATKPHLAYTLYDEIAIALRWITHSSFHAVLVAQQLLFRAMQIFGVYLFALAFPLRRSRAMLVAAVFALGAYVAGPAVVMFEYEPVPRGFAIGLLFLAMGLAAHNRFVAADIAAAVAFLYHPPTVWVFWLLYLWLILRRRSYRDLWPLALAVVILFVSSRFQIEAGVSQTFFGRISPELERLQRLRASYNWISMWSPDLLWQYVTLYVVSLLAFWRVRPQTSRLFLIGMPAIGLLSMPLSFVLIEKLKWSLMPQIQPARATLFITAFTIILSAAAAIRAIERKLWLEAVAWFTIAFALPSSGYFFSHLADRQFLWTVALALLFTASLALQRFRWAPFAAAAVAIVPFFAIPMLEHVRNYPSFEYAGASGLTQFVQAATPKDAVFLFGDAGSGPFPSIFRARSERAVYVDWKSGGQANYNEAFAMEWWRRWQNTNELRFEPSRVSRLPDLGIDYLVLEASHRLADTKPVFENTNFLVYQLRRQ